MKKIACLSMLLLAIAAQGVWGNAAASAANPASDPNNAQGWSFMEEFSDEFNNGTLDEGKWEKLPFSWRDTWLWDDDQAVESNGSLNLTMAYEATDKHNQTVKNWTTVGTANADSVTTEQHRSGDSALVHYLYSPYHVQTEQTIKGLVNGTYSFTAYVWSEGEQTTKRLVAKDFGGTTQYTDIDSNNGGYIQYTIDNIQVTNGQCTIAIESDAPAYSWLRIDDVAFFHNLSPQTNLVTNAGFETKNTVYYKSGGVRSFAEIKYGYLESRMFGSTPIPGTCPAFWLYGGDDTWGNEIDIIEFGQTPSNIRALDMVLHNWKKPGSTAHWSSGGTYVGSFNPSSSYHTYGLDWGPGYQKWYIDGVLRRTTNYADYDQIAMQIYASLGLREPYNTKATSSGFPGTASYDYVRVWKKSEQSIDDSLTGGYQAQFDFDGNWTAAAQSGSYLGKTHFSSTTDDYYQVKFYGTGINVFNSKGPGQGIGAYSIDGGAEILVDHYAAARVDNVSVWSSPNLTKGLHTLKVRVSGTKNTSATGTKISADRVDILN